MIGYLKGKVKYLTPEYVLLEVGGVGYEIICSGAAFSALSAVKKEEEGEVYTYLQVKEDGISLFGFRSLKEKELFLKLTSVQSVGAKMAISILSAMPPDEVYEVIATADSKRLSAVKGIGRKKAERIILELHDKITADELLGANPAERAAPQEDEDAIAALMGLGYNKQESVKAVERAKKAGAGTVEEILGFAIKGM